MFFCNMSKLHVNLPIMNAWESIFNEISLCKVSTSFEVSDIPQCLLFPSLLWLHSFSESGLKKSFCFCQ